MAVLGRLLISSAERLDLPDLLSIDSYSGGDWKFFLKGLVGDNKPYILKGFDIIDPGNAIGTQSCSIRVADSVVFYPGSDSGAFYHGLEENHPQAEPLVPELRKNAVNYVYLTFSTFNTSVDTRAFWDPDKDGGVGGEFTQDVNTESVLKVEVNVSVGSFPQNTIPIAKVTVGPVVITAIEDARDMMFRLGSGGITPDPFNTYAWRTLPGGGYERSEPPTEMLAGGVNPFQGADKNILSLKEWMDAVMSKLRELGGTIYWYEDTSTYSLISNFIDSVGTAFKSKGKWIHDTTTPGLLTWTEDINIKVTPDPRTYIVRNGNKTLADEQVMYIPMVRRQPFNGTDEEVQWTNGQPYINTIGGAVGLFTNLAKGDYVKKINDTNDKFLRVEEFYDAVNLGGSTTTAANARSVRLSGNYLGTTLAEKGRYDKGVYLASDVVVANRNSTSISSIGGNFHWMAMRSDTIENVANITTTSLVLDIEEHDGTTAKCTSGASHNLVDGDRLTIVGSTNFDGTYVVEVESATVFYITVSGGPYADESGIDAHYATVTTSARSTAYGLQLESANHGFNSNDKISIAGTTNYNGSSLINVRSATTFTIPVGSAYAVETAGTATLARVIVRTEGSAIQVIQGESAAIGGNAAENIRQYVGMGSLSETYPTYAVPPSYNTLDGQVNYNATINENLTVRVSKLTAMMADKAQDKTIKLLNSGYDSVVNTTNGAAQEITFTPTPPGGIPKLDVVLPSSANNGEVFLSGTLSLLVNQAAYIEIDRNATFSFANLAAVTVAPIEDVPLDENVLVLAIRLGTSEVWLWDGFYASSGITPTPSFLDLIVEQNENVKVVRGGTWSWDLTTETLTWSAAAKVQVTEITEDRNTIPAGSVVLANDGDVAYVEINRSAGALTNLTVNVDPIDSIVASLDTVIFARRVGNNVLVGNGTMLLKDREFLELDGALAEINRFFGQLRIRSQSTSSTKVEISAADVGKLDASVLGQELAGLLMKFDGAVIDFATGTINEEDDVTPLGQNFTPVTIAANQYRWYSISLIPNTVDSQNRITAQVLVLPGDADGATADAAPRAVFGGTKKIGQVVVQDDGTGGSGTILNIGQSNIVQLGTGSGSGSGTSPKLVGGGTFTWNSGTNSLSFTSDIFVEQPRLSYADNKIDQGTVSPIVLPTANHVAFIERLNASSGGPDLTILIDLITNVKDGQVIIARRDGSDVIVGSSSTRLINGESKKLYAGVSDQLLSALAAANNADNTGLMRLLENTTSPKRVNVTPVSKIVPDGTEYGQQLKNLLLDFEGAQIDFDTGNVYEADGTTPLPQNFTPATIAANQFRWYSVTLLPNTVSGDNRITGQLLILAASADGATADAAPRAAFPSSGIKIGQVVVQEDTGSIADIVQANIVQLSAGSAGGGDGDASAIIETLKNYHNDGTLSLLGYNVFGIQEDDLIDNSSTAEFSVVKGAVVFDNAGEVLLSTDMLSPEEFKQANDLPLNKVRLTGVWEETAVDSAATWELSRNGGNNWQEVEMERVGDGTDTFTGFHEFEHEYDAVQPVDLQNTSAEVEMDNGAAREKIAQQFTLSAESNIWQVGFELRKAGTITGSYRFAIYGDSASLPDENNKLWISSWQDVADLTGTLTLVSLPVNVLTDLAAGTYHLVLETDATYQADYSAGVDFMAVGRNNTAALNNAANATSAPVWSAQTYDYAATVDAKEYVNDDLQTQSSDNTSSDLNDTTRQKLSQMFTIAAGEKHLYRQLQMKINKATANAAGRYKIQVVADDSGNAGRPSTDEADIIAETPMFEVSDLSTGNNTLVMDLTFIRRAGDYHLVISTDQAYKNQYNTSAGVDKISVRTQSATTPDSRRYDGTNWANATGDGSWYRIMRGINMELLVRVTSSAGSKELMAYGVSYEESTGMVAQEEKPVEVMWIDGDADQTELFVENFTVDPDLVEVIDGDNGLTYVLGTFSVDGQTLKFDNGQFLRPGKTFKVTIRQLGAAKAYDDSSTNSRILAANHLGSTDATLDRSAPGRGIMLRRPDGTLRELTIDDTDNIVIYSV